MHRAIPLPFSPLPEAVIFDCDGTLVDSMGVHYIGWIEALSAHGAGHLLPEEKYLKLGGMPGPEVIRHVAALHGIDLPVEPILAIKRQAVRDRLDQITPLDPAAGWAHWCHQHAIPMAVASGGTRPFVIASLESAGLLPLFPVERIFTADDVPRGKPHPDLFLAAAAALGSVPARTLVVEDGPPGFQAAEAAGMPWLDVADFAPTPARRPDAPVRG